LSCGGVSTAQPYTLYTQLPSSTFAPAVYVLAAVSVQPACAKTHCAASSCAAPES